MNNLYVLFKVAEAYYVLPAMIVLHMETFKGVTPVPGAPPHVLGVVQIRQRVVPVVDLRLRFGAPAADLSIHSRVVVVEHETRVVGMLVDSAREVVSILQKDFTLPPDILSEQSSGFVSAVAYAGDRLVMLMDCAKVIGGNREEENGEERRSV